MQKSIATTATVGSPISTKPATAATPQIPVRITLPSGVEVPKSTGASMSSDMTIHKASKSEVDPSGANNRIGTDHMEAEYTEVSVGCVYSSREKWSRSALVSSRSNFIPRRCTPARQSAASGQREHDGEDRGGDL